MEQMLYMFKCHFSDLDLVSYLVSQQQIFLTGSRQVMQKPAFAISTFLQTESKLKTCTPSPCTNNLSQPTSHPAKSNLHHKHQGSLHTSQLPNLHKNFCHSGFSQCSSGKNHASLLRPASPKSTQISYDLQPCSQT